MPQMEYSFHLQQHVWFLHGEALKFGQIEAVSGSASAGDPPDIYYDIRTLVGRQMCARIAQSLVADADPPLALIERIKHG